MDNNNESKQFSIEEILRIENMMWEWINNNSSYESHLQIHPDPEDFTFSIVRNASVNDYIDCKLEKTDDPGMLRVISDTKDFSFDRTIPYEKTEFGTPTWELQEKNSLENLLWKILQTAQDAKDYEDHSYQMKKKYNLIMKKLPDKGTLLDTPYESWPISHIEDELKTIQNAISNKMEIIAPNDKQTVSFNPVVLENEFLEKERETLSRTYCTPDNITYDTLVFKHLYNYGMDGEYYPTEDDTIYFQMKSDCHGGCLFSKEIPIEKFNTEANDIRNEFFNKLHEIEQIGKEYDIPLRDRNHWFEGRRLFTDSCVDAVKHQLEENYVNLYNGITPEENEKIISTLEKWMEPSDERAPFSIVGATDCRNNNDLGKIKNSSDGIRIDINKSIPYFKDGSGIAISKKNGQFFLSVDVALNENRQNKVGHSKLYVKDMPVKLEDLGETLQKMNDAFRNTSTYDRDTAIFRSLGVKLPEISPNAINYMDKPLPAITNEQIFRKSLDMLSRELNKKGVTVKIGKITPISESVSDECHMTVKGPFYEAEITAIGKNIGDGKIKSFKVSNFNNQYIYPDSGVYPPFKEFASGLFLNRATKNASKILLTPKNIAELAHILPTHDKYYHNR